MVTAVDVITQINIKGPDAVYDFDYEKIINDDKLRAALATAQGCLGDFYEALDDIERLADEISNSDT